MVLDNEEMLNVQGGSLSIYASLAIIGGLICFAIGVLDGFLRPEKC